jgi:pilus assembly protein Flp/PilA
MVDRLNSFMVAAYARIATRDFRREEGQALTEYALVLGLIVVGAIAALTLIGGNVSGRITDVCKKLGAGC